MGTDEVQWVSELQKNLDLYVSPNIDQNLIVQYEIIDPLLIDWLMFYFGYQLKPSRTQRFLTRTQRKTKNLYDIKP